MTIAEPGNGRVGVVNEGFWGIAVKKGEDVPAVPAGPRRGAGSRVR